MLQGRALRFRMDAACAIMFFLYGYDAGVLGGVLETPQFLNSIGNPSGKYDISMITSAYTLAAFFSTPLVMIWGFKAGRKRILLLGCLVVVIGGAIQAAAINMVSMVMGRIICGFGIGFISTTVPVYQNEQSINKDTRGRGMAITCVFLASGVPVAYWLDYGMSFVQSSVSWRFPIALQALPAIVAGLIFSTCPDTPRWYYARGRIEDGDLTLCRLWALPLEHPTIQAEKQSIFAALELERNSTKPGWKDYFWDRSDLKVARRLTICFLVLSFQQLMSINFLVYYATVIFGQNGLDKNMSAILAGVLNTCLTIGTIPAIILLDRVGRRGLMLYSAIIMTVIMTVFVALLNLKTPTLATNWAASGLIIVYMMFYGVGWMAAPWQYAPEIAPLELRHTGAALNACGEWLWSFITVFAAPIGLADPKTGPKIWFWFYAFNVLAIPFIYFLCPETAGKQLEELDVLFCKPELRERIANERAAVIDAAMKRAEEQLGQGPLATPEEKKDELRHELVA